MKVINVEDIINLEQQKEDFNRLPIEEILWLENGKPLDIPKEVLKDWKFCGLSNICFITTGAYKDL